MEILYDDLSPRVTVHDIDDTCWFKIWESQPGNKELSETGSIILGTNFMGLIYAAFGLENDEVSLAKRKWDDTPSEIAETTKDGVPGAKRNGTNKTGATKNAATSVCVAGALSMTALITATMLIMTFKL